MTISTVRIFDKFSAAFSTYWINNGSIQNTYQIDLLLTLETKRIEPVCISDRAWYDMYRIHLGVEQKQMKALIGPLSFFIFKPLLTFFYF